MNTDTQPRSEQVGCRECREQRFHALSCGFNESTHGSNTTSLVLDSHRPPERVWITWDDCYAWDTPETGGDEYLHAHVGANAPSDEIVSARDGLCCGAAQQFHAAKKQKSIVENLTPQEMLEEIERRGGRVEFTRVNYFFAHTSGDQGGGFTREDAITALYRDVTCNTKEEK